MVYLMYMTLSSTFTTHLRSWAVHLIQTTADSLPFPNFKCIFLLIVAAGVTPSIHPNLRGPAKPTACHSCVDIGENKHGYIYRKILVTPLEWPTRWLLQIEYGNCEVTFRVLWRYFILCSSSLGVFCLEHL